MPKALHDKLMKQAKKMGLMGERSKSYVYATMAKIETKKKRKQKLKRKGKSK